MTWKTDVSAVSAAKSSKLPKYVSFFSLHSKHCKTGMNLNFITWPSVATNVLVGNIFQ